MKNLPELVSNDCSLYTDYIKRNEFIDSREHRNSDIASLGEWVHTCHFLVSGDKLYIKKCPERHPSVLLHNLSTYLDHEDSKGHFYDPKKEIFPTIYTAFMWP